jgi:hypothetical protein
MPFNIARHSPALLLQCVYDQFPVPLYSILQICNSQVFSRTMSHENIPRAVQIPSMVTRQIGNVRAVIDSDSVETCSMLANPEVDGQNKALAHTLHIAVALHRPVSM